MTALPTEREFSKLLERFADLDAASKVEQTDAAYERAAEAYDAVRDVYTAALAEIERLTPRATA